MPPTFLHTSRSLCALLFLILASCADRDHRIAISVPDQQLLLYKKGDLIAQYPVSTSKFGLGSEPGSYRTPTGEFAIRRKIGDGHPPGAVFKSRRPTGDILPVNAPGRDPIKTPSAATSTSMAPPKKQPSAPRPATVAFA